jgi:hypothetical protein
MIQKTKGIGLNILPKPYTNKKPIDLKMVINMARKKGYNIIVK